MMDPPLLRVATLQYWLRPVKNFSEFAEQVRQWVHNAADYNAKVVIFPEYFTLQLMSLSSSDHALPELIHSVSDYYFKFQKLIEELAVRYEITVIAGSIPRSSASGKTYNECLVMAPNGISEVQAKIKVTRFEKEDFGVTHCPEAKLKIFEAEWGKFAVAICYDVEFPETVRAAALAGAEVLFVPSCTDDRQGYYRVRYCAQARAIENQIYVVQSSTVGGLSSFPSVCLNHGQSAIYTPSDYGFARDGILAEGIPNTETMVLGDLDLSLLRVTRASGTVLPFLDAQNNEMPCLQVEQVSLLK